MPCRATDLDCGAVGELTPAAMLRYMQTAATGHIEATGVTRERLLGEHHMLFVLASAAIRVLRAPSLREEFWVCTCPIKSHGAYMMRETSIFSPAGELLVEGQTGWSLLSTDTWRPLRVESYPYGMQYHPDWQPFFDPSRLRIRLPEGESAAVLERREVRLSDIDANHHVNNTVYGDILTDAFARAFLERDILEFYIRYRTQARLGDFIELSGCETQSEGILLGDVKGVRCFEGRMVFGRPRESAADGVLPL